ASNTAPSITAIAVVPSSPSESTNISCNITVRDAEQSTTNITYEWYKNGVNQTSLAGTFNNLANNTATLISNLTAGNFSKGQNWSCNARAYDGTDYSSWNMSANVTIQNSAPTVSSASINSTLFSGSPVLYTGDTMRGFCSATDSDGDSLKYWWAFYKNGSLFSSGNTTNYTQGTAINVANITGSDVKSANWTLECKADDATTNSTATNSTQLNLASCFNLNITGQTYTLNENASINGATCYNISAANITLNCAGYWVTGNNASSTYGAYSNQFNSTIKNCNISNFSTGIYFAGATNGTIQNNNISNSNITGIFFNATASSNVLSSNRICSNTLDINSTNSSNTGSSDTCDSFSGWSESSHLGCTFTCTPLWHRVYGNFTAGNTFLGASNVSPYAYSWTATGGVNVYFTDYDASVNWQNLTAIGKTISGENSSNDFIELDSVYNTSSYYDNINRTYSTDGNTPVQTDSFTVFSRTVAGVPIAPSHTYSTAFKTGILWDASDGGTEFTNSVNQTTVWAVKVNQTAIPDVFGTYQYLGEVPFKLSMIEGENNLVAIYADLQ
ncbi:MAG: hypothetical protein QW568_03840, partial [Candidatus Anstonellaceae archaeon]